MRLYFFETCLEIILLIVFSNILYKLEGGVAIEIEKLKELDRMKIKKSILYMKKEADGFRCVFNEINNILIDDLMGENIGKEIMEVDLINPGIVNGCFTCELYLKIILRLQKKITKKTHNLKYLFYSINGKTQNYIIEQFKEKGYTKRIFKKELKYIANGYNISRYYYENNEIYDMLSGFIYRLIEVLKEVVEGQN